MNFIFIDIFVFFLCTLYFEYEFYTNGLPLEYSLIFISTISYTHIFLFYFLFFDDLTLFLIILFYFFHVLFYFSFLHLIFYYTRFQFPFVQFPSF